MIPKQDYNYPECWAEYSIEQKKRKAQELFADYGYGAINISQGDFKLASLVAYKIAVDHFKNPENVFSDLNQNILNGENSICMPVTYAGGNMDFGRVF